MAAEKHQRIRVAVAFGLVYVLWGATYLAMRVVVEHIPAYVLGSVRFVVAGLLMLAWCAWSGRKLRIDARDAFRLVVIGILLLSVANMGVASSEEYLPSGLAALIVAGVPIWVAIIETWIFRSRRLSPMGLAGLALGLVGLLVLLWPKISGTDLDRVQLLAFGILLIASASWALGSVLAGQWTLSVDVLTASAWEMTFAGLANTLVALVTGGFRQATWTTRGALAITFLVICGSWIGFTAYIWLLEHVPTPKVATYAYVNPVVAVYLGWLFLDERVDGSMVAGTLVIISGVALVNLSQLRSLGAPITTGKRGLSAVEPTGDD
jgi:drug/metabolite transporter (DMT)-like permease